MVSGIVKRFRRISRYLNPFYDDAGLQDRSDKEFRARVRSGIKVAGPALLFLDIAFALVGPGDMPLSIWVYVMTASCIKTVLVLAMWLFSSREWMWRHYNALVSVVAGSYLLTMSLSQRNVVTLTGADPLPPALDEAYRLFFIATGLPCCLVLLEPDIRYLLAEIHLHVVLLLILFMTIGVSIDTSQYLKMVMGYYVASMFLLEMARRQKQQRHRMLEMQVDLELHAEEDKAAMRAERDEALLRASLADQKAMQSLMGAVFDINGFLQWRSASDVAEPHLCFTSEPHPILDDLLQQPAAEQPLDIILGPAPRDGTSKDRWLRERERLWSYSCREAVPPPAVDDGEEVPAAPGPARKISVTGSTLHGKTFDMELFLTPCGDDRVLFGILAEAKERFCPAPTDQTEPSTTLRLDHSSVRAVSMPSESRRSSHSGASSQSVASASPLPLDDGGPDGPVTIWVDMLQPEIPIIKCTAEFLAVFGTVLPESTSLKERLVDGGIFRKWLRACTKQHWQEFSAGCTPNEATVVNIAPVEFAMWVDTRQRTQVRGTCKLDFSKVLEQSDAEASKQAPVGLVLQNCRMCRMMPSKKKRSQPGGAMAGDNTAVDLLLPLALRQAIHDADCQMASDIAPADLDSLLTNKKVVAL